MALYKCEYYYYYYYYVTERLVILPCVFWRKACWDAILLVLTSAIGGDVLPCIAG